VTYEQNKKHAPLHPICRGGFWKCHQAADQAIAACGGDARDTVKALIIANQFLEIDLEKLRAAVSMDYTRGRTAKTLPMTERIGMIKLPGD
jgi:hypothetical protein